MDPCILISVCRCFLYMCWLYMMHQWAWVEVQHLYLWMCCVFNAWVSLIEIWLRADWCLEHRARSDTCCDGARKWDTKVYHLDDFEYCSLHNKKQSVMFAHVFDMCLYTSFGKLWLRSVSLFVKFFCQQVFRSMGVVCVALIDMYSCHVLVSVGVVCDWHMYAYLVMFSFQWVWSV